jgi:hypothetical protein
MTIAELIEADAGALEATSSGDRVQLRFTLEATIAFLEGPASR